MAHAFRDRCEWYVEPIRGIGYAVKRMKFIDEPDPEMDSVVFIGSDKDACEEVIETHNAQSIVVENKASVLRQQD